MYSAYTLRCIPPTHFDDFFLTSVNTALTRRDPRDILVRKKLLSLELDGAFAVTVETLRTLSPLEAPTKGTNRASLGWERLLVVAVVLIIVVGTFVLASGKAWAKGSSIAEPAPAPMSSTAEPAPAPMSSTQVQQHAPERGVAGSAKPAGEEQHDGNHMVTPTTAPSHPEPAASHSDPISRSDPDVHASQAPEPYYQRPSDQQHTEAQTEPHPESMGHDGAEPAELGPDDPAFKPAAKGAPVGVVPGPVLVSYGRYNQTGLPPSAALESEPTSGAVSADHSSSVANNSEAPVSVSDAVPTGAPTPTPSVSYSVERASPPIVDVVDTISGAVRGGMLNTLSTFRDAVVSTVSATTDKLTQFFSWMWGFLKSTVPPVPLRTSLIICSSSGSGSSFHSGGISLIAMLAGFAILIGGSRFSWLSRQLLKPNSVLRLALERPG